ncbi:hypothetical protein CHS0354_021968 [Potamilus streckersoni]|uniref:Nicotinamide N-methyltransferase-like n=1 Tax=Potamilus streckersoni TaxID=2493646 RepID=A0AAE0SK40_9BIVA|nr:hypothetical protein CHS0354_021968 [Potamilus streckersoni]
MSADTELTSHKEVAFDPDTYVSMYYSTVAGEVEEGEMLKFFLDGLNDAFKSGAITGAKLLDIGTGPTPHTTFCAAPWFDEITLSDFSQKNLEFLQKWKNGEVSHMGPIFEYLAQLDNTRSCVEERLDELRKKTKNVVHCDVTQSNPVSSTPVDGVVFDAITSSLCLEVASTTLEDYVKSVRNLSALLKPGGHLVLSGVLECTFYRVGNVKFKNIHITKDQLQDIYKKEGFEILSLKDLNENYAPHMDETYYSDFKNAFFMVAKKAEH